MNWNYRTSTDAASDPLQLADHLIGMGGSYASSCGALLARVLSDFGPADAMDPLMSHGLLDPATLFDIFTTNRLGGLLPHLTPAFATVALPRQLLMNSLQPGDILIRRALGEPGIGHAAFLAAPQTCARDEAWSRGWQLESGRPGYYVQVIEGGAVPHRMGYRFARRIAGPEGQVPPDTLVLRMRRGPRRYVESDAANGNGAGNGSNGASPNGKGAGNANGSTPAIDMCKAVTANRQNRTQLGWDSRGYELAMLLGVSCLPSDEDFAQAVANWQSSQGLAGNGILDADTWNAMQTFLGPGPVNGDAGVAAPPSVAGSPAATPDSGATAKTAGEQAPPNPAAPQGPAVPPVAPQGPAQGPAPPQGAHPAPHPAAPAHPAFGPPAAVAGMPLGVDVYTSNTLTAASFQNLKTRGKKFAITKSSQGLVADAAPGLTFAMYYQWIKDAGMIRGSFHFFTNKRSTDHLWGGSVADQANTVLHLIPRLAPGDLAPALDLEDEPRGAHHRRPLDEGIFPGEHGYNYLHSQAGKDEVLADSQDFLDRIETRLGRTPLIYTSIMWTDDLNNPQVMSQYPVWTVAHRQNLPGLVIGAWGHDWDLVQYAEERGNWWGINPYREPHINLDGGDFDAFHGTIHGLRGLADMGRPGIAMVGNNAYIVHSDENDNLHILAPNPWADTNLTQVLPQSELSGSDPVFLATSSNLFLYYRRGDELFEAFSTPTSLTTWQTTPIADVQGPFHNPKAVLNGTRRHVVYWGVDDDWHLVNWNGGWSNSGSILTLAGIKTSATQGQATGQPTIYISGGTCHMTGRVGSDGHLYDVWHNGTAWRGDDLTALARNVTPTMPAATYSPCVYQIRNDVGIVFRAVGGELWVIMRSNNAPTNITNATHATLAAGHPTCFVLNNEPHIVYRGIDKSVYEIWLHGGTWSVQQVCAISAAAEPVATSTATSGQVAVRTQDGTIFLAQFDGVAWSCAAAR